MFEGLTKKGEASEAQEEIVATLKNSIGKSKKDYEREEERIDQLLRKEFGSEEVVWLEETYLPHAESTWFHEERLSKAREAEELLANNLREESSRGDVVLDDNVGFIGSTTSVDDRGDESDKPPEDRQTNTLKQGWYNEKRRHWEHRVTKRWIVEEIKNI